MFVDRFIFKNNQFTLCPCLTFIPKTGVGLSKIGVSFYCAIHKVALPKKNVFSTHINIVFVNENAPVLSGNK